MPREMPNDFDFSVRFGVLCRNEINTFTDTVTKDLIADGTATAQLTFTANELARIYQKMREINILAPKQLVPEQTTCTQTPHGEDRWEIRVNGKIKTIFWSGMYCETTRDARQLIALRNDIFNIVKTKEAYRKLPEPVGGYE